MPNDVPIIELVWILAYITIFLALFGWSTSTGLVKKLRIELELADSAFFAGEDVHLSLTIANSGRMPLLWLSIRQNMPPGLNLDGSLSQPLVVSLAGRELRRFDMTLSSLKRGHYPLGPLVLETGDILGITGNRIEHLHNRTIMVYPHVHDLSRFRTPARIPFGSPHSRNTSTDDPSWVKGIRTYLPGDPLSKIHWKASARSGQLQTKELDPAVTLDSVVLLDMDLPSYPQRYYDHLVELAVEVSASLASALLARRCNTALLTNLASIESLRGKSLDALPTMLGFLSILQPGSGYRLAESIRRSAAEVGLGGIVYIVTPTVSDECVEAAYSLVKGGRSPVVVHVCPRDRVASRMANLNRSSVKYIRAQRGQAWHSLELIS